MIADFRLSSKRFQNNSPISLLRAFPYVGNSSPKFNAKIKVIFGELKGYYTKFHKEPQSYTKRFCLYLIVFNFSIMDENQLSNIVIGCAIEVHRQLDTGLLESAYQYCLLYELKKAGLNVQQEKPMPIIYKEIKLDHGYRIDLLCGRLPKQASSTARPAGATPRRQDRCWRR